MLYEVEMKFPVTDLEVVRRKLAAMGVVIDEPLEERDCYYAHPARDFAQTDEALRIRRSDGRNRITYKGPKIDSETKTRRELDLDLPTASDAPAGFAALLEALGFRPVGEVHKRRCKARMEHQGRRIEVSLDQVSDVGSFVELELVTDESDVEAAKQCIASAAGLLDLTVTERRGYLDLLLRKQTRS